MDIVRKPENEKLQTLTEHLKDLRTCLVRSIAGLLLVVVCCMPFMGKIFDIFTNPLISAMPKNSHMLSVGVVSPVMVPIKMTLFLSFVLSLPWILYQIWNFIGPGLYKKEKKTVIPIVISSFAMFLLGIAYCYFVVFGMIFKFIAGFSPETISFAPDIDSYISFMLTMFLSFGVVFETPVLVIFLYKTGAVTIEKLKKGFPYVLIGAFVIAAIFTPPDVLSQFLLAAPLVLLYSLSIVLISLFKKKDNEKELDRAEAENS